MLGNRWERQELQAAVSAIPYSVCVAKTTPQGKPGVGVDGHCSYVGEVARTLLARMPEALRRMMPDGVATLAALHDVGKISPGFQARILSADELNARAASLGDIITPGFCTNHAEIGEASIARWYRERGGDEGDRTWGQVAGRHHGRRTEPASAVAERYGGQVWEAERESLIAALLSAFGPLPEVPPTSCDLMLASGLTCVSDWIASDERFYPPQGLAEGADAAVQATIALDRAGWRYPSLTRDLSFAEVFGFPPNPMQQAVAEAVDTPGVYIIEAPTGLGKTEAALFAAYRLMASEANCGLYFALPTRLTSNRIHERVNRFLTQITVDAEHARLVHGQAWIQELAAGGELFRSGRAWFHPIKRALLLPFGVGTIDQALLGVLRVRHHFLRGFGLAGKVVVLDEVHSYDVYTGVLIDILIDMLTQLNCTVIVLSATLTRERRGTLLTGGTIPTEDRYPLITAGAPGVAAITTPMAPPAERRIECRVSDTQTGEVAQWALKQARRGACVLWIVNTVRSSQEAYSSVAAEMREAELPVGLLHARYPAYRREELESKWVGALEKDGSRPDGCVLVATQVVEQSVDIDADYMISELAPSDMLLQRLGRLWRHQRVRPVSCPRMDIVSPALEKIGGKGEVLEMLGGNGWVYAPYVLWRTYCIWRHRGCLALPADTRELLETTYAEPNPEDPEWVHQCFEELEMRRAQLKRMALGATAAAMPVLVDDEDAATRYSSYPQIPLLLVQEIESTGTAANIRLMSGTAVEVREGERDLHVTAALHRNLVTVPRYWVSATTIPPHLRSHIYGRVVVARVDPDGQLYDVERGLALAIAYDATRGVYRRAESTNLDVAEKLGDFGDELDW